MSEFVLLLLLSVVSANPSRSVTEGETVTLTCLISNSGDGTGLVWYHGRIYISQGNQLTLNKVKRFQQGEWKCFLYHQHNSPFASYTLELTSTGSDVWQAPAVKKYFIQDGGKVSLSCDEADPGFQWKDHSQQTRAVTWKWRSHDGTTQRYDQNIQYPSQPSDYRDQFPLTLSQVTFSRGGVYTCEFTGYYRTGTLTMELVTMKVSANPSRSVTEGETVTLTCLISNSGYGTVLVWYHGDIYIDQGNSVLILNKVKRSQQGQWKCAIHDQQNSPFASYKLQFRPTGSHVEKAPAVQKYFIHEGGEVSLSCDESDPGFQWKDHSQRTRAVTWKWRSHDGTTQRYDQNIQYPSQLSDYRDQFPLTLSQVTFSRGGVYTCEFTGYYRTGTLTMELVTMKVSSNTSDTVAEGDSISLTCQLSNDSYAHMVRWIHNGIEISHQSSLVLVKVKAAQSGLWKCSLKRESGEISEVAYNLNVQKIGAEQNAPRNYAAKIGEGTTLPCTESDPGFVWRSSSNESRSVTWYWRPRGDSTVRTILAAHPAGPHAAFSSHLNSHVTISSSAFDNDDFSLTISVVNESSAGVYTCQLTGYYRSGSLMSEMFTTQVSRASPYVSVAIGVVLAVLLSAGAAVVVVCYRRRKLNAGPQHGQGNSVNLQEMAAGERTTDENRQAYEEEALVYSQIEALPESSGSQPQHNQNVGVIYASVNAEDQHTNEVAYSVVQASAADKMKPKVKPKGNGGSPNAVVNRPEHDNNEVVYSVVQVAAAGNMKPKPKPKRDGGDPNAVANRSEHDNNEVVYSVVQAPAAGNIKPKLKPKPKRDGGDPNAVVDRSEHDKNEAVNSMVQAPAAGNMNPNAVVNRPQPEENQVVYSLLSTPNASKPALKPKPNKAVDALYTVVAKKK
ncbi:basement membrane-specific heparan sulfate proteoglycan core protein-like isoform X3 [Petromyzon marinus]|uniref:basement membrane-specific heparan sulfate proteoglycan core protein-like isoform X3 n=1 Tax=Petromyzon marinus TaxID=7757 RepID=UPI003F6E4FDB